jgi:hypothetical protein
MAELNKTDFNLKADYNYSPLNKKVLESIKTEIERVDAGELEEKIRILKERENKPGSRAFRFDDLKETNEKSSSE